jgi:2-keto-myo-inositol isomerase
MPAPIGFALNHIAAPRRDCASFFDLARRVGLDKVEIRNDLAGVPILDDTPASIVRHQAQSAGVRILTINALQRFNEWNEHRATEARELARHVRDCGAQALVLVPVNDAGYRPGERRLAERLREALRGLKPILADAGVLGFVEPLGFEKCSLRSKGEALAAIDDVDGAHVFQLVHDTFHHFLSGETEIYPRGTGLVHISGVDDHNLMVADMRDAHRVLVDEHDVLGNIAQIAALRAGGYGGVFSFEPFAARIQEAPDIERRLRDSMNLVTKRLGQASEG